MNIERHSRGQRTEAGFTLIELLIVMSVVLILMTLAVPALQKTIKHANETSAIKSLNLVRDMEAQYHSTYPTRGFACSLVALGGKPGSAPPTPDSAQLIPDDLAAGNKAGYTFSITCGGKATVNNQDQYNTYQVTAVPNSVGHSGDRGFCADEYGRVTFDPKGGTSCTELLQ